LPNILKISKQPQDLDYEIDGLVIKINDLKSRDELVLPSIIRDGLLHLNLMLRLRKRRLFLSLFKSEEADAQRL